MGEARFAGSSIVENDVISSDLLSDYALDAAYDEMFAGPEKPREHYETLHQRLATLTGADFRRRKAMTELSMRQEGVGFTVYRQEEGIERIWPMDPVPRIVPAAEWRTIEAGLVQRLTALNLFLKDVYGDQFILRDRRIDPSLVLGGAYYRREFAGAKAPRDIYIHVCGSDLIRDVDGQYYVLEDNARTPSGVSYMLQNRYVLKRVFPQLFDEYEVRATDDYPAALLEVLRYIAPATHDPTVVLLSPGIYNSAYFEHSYLAQRMGIELVEG
ncbi:MAG TPA: circularly permuted type 2 ATP-grasp protein, partial [Planctomycetia bacterium]|nr:circularly permuted type 2 ATP-grasp protein [Planctomycetia bacterium]